MVFLRFYIFLVDRILFTEFPGYLTVACYSFTISALLRATVYVLLCVCVSYYLFVPTPNELVFVPASCVPGCLRSSSPNVLLLMVNELNKHVLLQKNYYYVFFRVTSAVLVMI